MSVDGIKWVPLAHVDKYSPEQVKWVQGKTGILEPQGIDFQTLDMTPEDGVFESLGNQLTNAGLTRITSLINAAGGQGLTNTATRIGVGNGTTAFASTDTDLSAVAGSSNRYFMTMDATYPSTSVGVITARATFGVSDGNFNWQEWGLDIGTPTVTAGTTVNATLINRKVPGSMGTKASGASWVFTVTITLA
jgi:hypothetical protein